MIRNIIKIVRFSYPILILMVEAWQIQSWKVGEMHTLFVLVTTKKLTYRKIKYIVTELIRKLIRGLKMMTGALEVAKMNLKLLKDQKHSFSETEAQVIFIYDM